MQLPSALVSPSSKKFKKIYSKKIFYISPQKYFLVFQENGTLMFLEVQRLSPGSRNKKNALYKKFLYFFKFQEMELSSCNFKKFLIFSQKKGFLIFQEMETQKKFLIFQEVTF